MTYILLLESSLGPVRWWLARVLCRTPHLALSTPAENSQRRWTLASGWEDGPLGS